MPSHTEQRLAVFSRPARLPDRKTQLRSWFSYKLRCHFSCCQIVKEQCPEIRGIPHQISGERGTILPGNATVKQPESSFDDFANITAILLLMDRQIPLLSMLSSHPVTDRCSANFIRKSRNTGTRAFIAPRIHDSTMQCL